MNRKKETTHVASHHILLLKSYCYSRNKDRQAAPFTPPQSTALDKTSRAAAMEMKGNAATSPPRGRTASPHSPSPTSAETASIMLQPRDTGQWGNKSCMSIHSRYQTQISHAYQFSVSKSFWVRLALGTSWPSRMREGTSKHELALFLTRSDEGGHQYHASYYRIRKCSRREQILFQY